MFQLILPFQLELPLEQPVAAHGQGLAAHFAGDALAELAAAGRGACVQGALALRTPVSEEAVAPGAPKRRRRRVRVAAQEP